MKKVLLAVILFSQTAFLGCGKHHKSDVNRAPIITKIVAKKSAPAPGETVTVTVEASDPDGDKLSFSWSASRGKVSGSGAAVKWTAPDKEGKYTLEALVKDPAGMQTSSSITLSVKTPAGSGEPISSPPSISSINVQENGDTWPAWEGDISAIVADEDGVQKVEVVIDDDKNLELARFQMMQGKSNAYSATIRFETQKFEEKQNFTLKIVAIDTKENLAEAPAGNVQIVFPAIPPLP